MRILLVHFEDNPENGPWAKQRWNRIVDLGLGGKGTYQRWKQRFNCQVESFDSLRNGFEDFRKVRELLGRGCGQFIDEFGLDWWEIMSILLHEQMETLVLLQRFAQSIGPQDEVHVSRPNLHAGLLDLLLPGQVKFFPLQRGQKKGSLEHYVRVSTRLSAPQLVDVFWDKYDSGYQFRGRWTRRRRASSRPAVLLPTAYVNVSRSAAAFANTFPEENFLLVTTRQSGWIKDLPKNLEAAWLSSYASIRDRGRENEWMESQWQALRKKLEAAPEFEILGRLGYLDGFSRQFRRGVEVRDAWRNVLDDEPVKGVICGDDSNPYTRIPLLLAQSRGLLNIASHHGALDGRYLFKRSYAGIIWAKGRMEKDYLVRQCGVPEARVEICAPRIATSSYEKERENRDNRRHILFISESYDVGGGRAEEFYRDVLPTLADLALAHGHKLIVKLHPVESERQRSGMLARILSPEQRMSTRLIAGPMTEDLLGEAWFGITILSTVAMECAIRGVPCFLCKWLEFWPYRYVEQFIRFGVGVGLEDPSEIKKIPEYLQRIQWSAPDGENWWQSAPPQRLRELLSSGRKEYTAAVS
jgi:hypothetical protein